MSNWEYIRANIIARVEAMETFLLISGGAVLGANLRYWMSDFITQHIHTAFPFGTLIINASGSFILGLLVTLAAEQFVVDSRLRLIFIVGFLGAFTTFSTYSYESINLILKGQVMSGLVNLFGSALVGIAAVGAGIYVGRIIA